MAHAVVKAFATGALLYAARRYFRDWGTTKAESGGTMPGDELFPSPVLQATEGVWIDAPAERVWPWLVQLGQDRGGLYSFEKLENLVGLHYRNAGRLHPEWQHLRVGDTVRLVPERWLGLPGGVELDVAEMADGRSIVLRGGPPRLPVDVVWSFQVTPHWDDRCRLLVRTRLALRRPTDFLLAELIGPLRAFVVRGMLLGIKRRAENASESVVPAPESSADRHPGARVARKGSP